MYKIILGILLVGFLFYVFYGILVTAKEGKGGNWPPYPTR